jgi:subtilisin family serine protease
MMAAIDDYLLQLFSELERDQSSDRYRDAGRLLLPMLVRVVDARAVPEISEAPDCVVTGVVGSIVACRGSRETLHKLANNPKVLSIESSRPSSGLDCANSVPFVRANQVHRDPNHPERGDAALVAIIDNGIDVLHEAFLDRNRDTRIEAIWDQTDPTGPGPTIPGCRSYGTLHIAADIEGYILAGNVPPGLGRNPATRNAKGEAVGNGGHGTHVASIAAGRTTQDFAGGVAPEARLVVVIATIEADAADPVSIGYSKSHVDALSFIELEADRLTLPVVVNVSAGMNAGAHDGTSALEAAFDMFTKGGRLPGRAVVKSAGNQRGFGGHARFAMLPNSAETLSWQSRKGHAGPDVVELWFRASDDLKFSLTDPSGDQTPWVDADNRQKQGRFPSGYEYDIRYSKFHWDNGDSRVLVRVMGGQHAWIDVGDWRLEVHSDAVQSEGRVHAWLERKDPRAVAFSNHQSEEFTLSIPGTARTVVAVGSVASQMPAKVALYSSFGPTRDRRDKPDLVAPGEKIVAAQGGTTDGAVAMSGTSMAAPHVSGAIALLFSAQAKRMRTDSAIKQLNAAQIRAGLEQSSQNFNGRSTASLGYGVLDVEKLLSRFGH